MVNEENVQEIVRKLNEAVGQYSREATSKLGRGIPIDMDEYRKRIDENRRALLRKYPKKDVKEGYRRFALQLGIALDV